MKRLAMSDELKSLYNGHYEGASEWRWLCAVDKANNIIALSKKYQHKTILDIGSGEGSVIKRLSDLRFGDTLYSVEVSETAVEAIRQRNIESLIECRLFDGYNLPYEDDKFGLAILSHVIEHLEYPRKMLYEASRVARYIFVEVPLQDNMRLKRDFTFDRVGHINFYSLKTIRRLVQTCGLEVKSQRITNPSLSIYRYRCGNTAIMRYLPKEIMLRLVPSAATLLWTYHCSLLCSKRTSSNMLQKA
jgi:SAM-dependent methyltransferase